MAYARRKAAFVNKRMNRSGIVCLPFDLCRAALAIFAVAVCLPHIAGCSAPPGQTYIHMETLEVAAEARLSEPQRAVVLDESRIASLVRSVNDRVALIEIRDDREWDVFRATCVGLGPRPNFSCGAFVAVMTRVGQPLDGEWPCRLEGVRVVQGAGLVNATLRGGTYLPDGTTYIDGAIVCGLRRSLVLEINGDRFPLK